jgi:hypothetical protein
MMDVMLRIQIKNWHHLDHTLRDRHRRSLRLAGEYYNKDSK